MIPNKNLKKIFFFFTTALFCLHSLSSQPPPSSQLPKEIEQVLLSYQKQSSIVMDVKKTFSQPILNRKRKSSGKFFSSGGLWRLDMSSPQASHTIFNGKSVLFLRPDNNTKHHLSLSQMTILPVLLDSQKFLSSFKYEGTSSKGRTKIHSFLGKKESSPKQLSIQIEKDRVLSLFVEWPEPLGQEHYRFSSIRFGIKLDKKLFEHP